MEERLPGVCGGKEDGNEEGTYAANHRVEEGGKGGFIVRALELLDRFVEIDDAVEEGKDLGAEGCHIAHGPIVCVEDGEKEVHPAGVDARPCHEGEVGDLDGRVRERFDRRRMDGWTYVEAFMAEVVYSLAENAERSSNAKNR